MFFLKSSPKQIRLNSLEYKNDIVKVSLYGMNSIYYF